MPTVIIDCDRNNSGYFEYDTNTTTYTGSPPDNGSSGFTYDSDASDWVEYRMVFKFDTSDANTGIPAGDTITKVELRYSPSSPPVATVGSPNSWTTSFKAGNIVGATFDGTSAEWSAGTIVHQEYGSLGTSAKWIDLTSLWGTDWIDTYFDRSGDTDFLIVDESSEDEQDAAEWFHSYWNGLPMPRRGRLQITYQTQVELDELTATMSAVDMTVSPGAASVTLDELVADLSVVDLTVSPGPVSVTLDELTVDLSVVDLTVSVGAVQIALDALVVDLSVVDLTVSPGAVQIALDELTATLSTVDLTVTQTIPDVSVTLDTLTLTMSAVDLTVDSGSTSILLDTLTLTLSAEQISRRGGTITLPETGVEIVATEEGLFLVPVEDGIETVPAEDGEETPPAEEGLWIADAEDGEELV